MQQPNWPSRATLPVAAFVVALGIVLAGCRGGGSSGSSVNPSPSPGVELTGVALAGPTCPVEHNPPDPSCAPRPVPNATISIEDASGQEVGSVSTDGQGRFSVLLAPGQYRLVPQTVDSMMRAQPVDVSIESGVQPKAVEIDYDTGIR